MTCDIWPRQARMAIEMNIRQRQFYVDTATASPLIIQNVTGIMSRANQGAPVLQVQFGFVNLIQGQLRLFFVFLTEAR